jgi:CelD/BcsL family acetyltransferase involved in cellulose biosynthesis
MAGSSLGSGAQGAVELVEIGDPAWTNFVAGHREATCFHQPAWVTTLVGAYGFRARAAVQRNADGVVVAGVPLVEVRRLTGARRWSCLPFSDECAPLVANGGSAEPLLQGVDALRRARGVGDLEIRTAVQLPGANCREVAVTHSLALPAAVEGVARPAGTRPSVRRHVATSDRLGVRVDLARSVDDVTGTYYGLHVLTRRRQGVPTQPRAYFRFLWERMIEPGHGFVLIARKDGQAVAGAVFLLGNRTVTYKYGASDDRFWSLRPNHAVMAHAITLGIQRGFANFDFGRTDLDNPGLARFKESWGAQAQPLHYTSFSARGGRRDGPPRRGLLTTVIQRSPSIVCRGLGELLYRYAA